MVSSSPSSSSSANTLEPWFLKALRLLHSSSQHDTARLRKMYKDACENEATITRLTLADAMRSEPSEESASLERVPSRTRITAPVPAEAGVQNEPSGSKLAPKLINLFDVPSTKARGPSPSTNCKPLFLYLLFSLRFHSRTFHFLWFNVYLVCLIKEAIQAAGLYSFQSYILRQGTVHENKGFF